jgi:outer membrane receptor protein involved in Fe transport
VRAGALALGLCLLSSSIPAEEPPRTEATSQEPSPAATPAPTGLQTPRETMVVTPSRGRRTSIIDSPAAVSVISSDVIAVAPDRSFGELLRAVPGMNAVRYSVRDYNVTARQGTSTLSNSQLVLVDGRSVYQDFIGIILWDMIPVDPADIAQIEVVRGPASAVWGANAFTGVVNIVTRPPREAEGSTIDLSLINFNRDAGSSVGRGAGLAYRGTASLSRAIDERLAYRVAGGLFVGSPLPRPVGVLPLIPHPLVPGSEVGGERLPDDVQGESGDYRNRGTTQPWMDLRFDQELRTSKVAEQRITYAAGVSGTDGIVHTGIGPFNLERGSVNGYARTSYRRDRLNAMLYVNVLRVKGPNLLAFDTDEKPLQLSVRSRTYNLDLSDSRLLGGKNIVTYGGNLRWDTFRVNLAPNGKDRGQVGAFAQDELFLGWGERRPHELRFVLGARLDKFGNMKGPVFSPRLSCIWKPGPEHALRASVNKAFRAPSFVNNYLDQTVLTPVDLQPLFPDLPPQYAPLVEDRFLLPQRVLGNPDLHEESITAYEVGYVGSLKGETTLGFNAYVNDARDNINFFRFPDKHDPYTANDPPLGWLLPPQFITELAARGHFLSRTANQFSNLGPIRTKGVELFLEHHFAASLLGFLNYSWQPNPRPLRSPRPFPPLEITIPPRHRVNAGISWSGPRLLGSLSLNHASRAFWVDVLPHGFDGYTESYSMFNASVGVRLARGRILTTLRGTNLTNDEVRQNVFGDITKRMVSLDARFGF